MTRDEVFALVSAERDRQRVLFSGKHRWGEGDCSSTGVHPVVKSVVLAEEVGEVARAVLDDDTDGLRTELVQVAAVAVAWLESL